jgi:hypothetical protein
MLILASPSLWRASRAWAWRASPTTRSTGGEHQVRHTTSCCRSRISCCSFSVSSLLCLVCRSLWLQWLWLQGCGWHMFQCSGWLSAVLLALGLCCYVVAGLSVSGRYSSMESAAPAVFGGRPSQRSSGSEFSLDGLRLAEIQFCQLLMDACCRLVRQVVSASVVVCLWSHE